MQIHFSLPVQQDLSAIYSPWNYEGDTLGKVIAWAGFFFGGWAYHPFSAIGSAITQAYLWLTSGCKARSVFEQAVLSDPIANGLAQFSNPSVVGQVHGIYITTNETQLEAARQLFRDHPRPSSETIHIGCAAWHNFDIICARRSTYGLIVDFNPSNAEFIRKTIQLIKESPTRETFIQAMTAELNALTGRDRALFFHGDQRGLPTDRIAMELQREGSWLQSEENYLYIKHQLVSRDRLVAITEDITNDLTFSNIRRYLNSNNIAIDTLYTSNICNFMSTPANKAAFARSIKQLLHNETLFIHCPSRLVQRQTLGREVLAASYDSRRLFEEVISRSSACAD